MNLAASLTTVLALAAGGVMLATTGRWRIALPVTLDLFLAAGLLRIGVGGGWQGIATAALIVVIRRAVTMSLRYADAARSVNARTT